MRPALSYVEYPALPWGSKPTPEQQERMEFHNVLKAANIARREQLMRDHVLYGEVEKFAVEHRIPAEWVFSALGERIGDPYAPDAPVEYADTPELAFRVYAFYNPDAIAFGPSVSDTKESQRTEQRQQRQQRHAERTAFVQLHAQWLADCAERQRRHAAARARHREGMTVARFTFEAAKRAYSDEQARLAEELREAVSDPAPEQPKRQA